MSLSGYDKDVWYLSHKSKINNIFGWFHSAVFYTKNKKGLVWRQYVYRARTGHVKPWRVIKFDSISFSRPGKSWNIVAGHGNS